MLSQLFKEPKVPVVSSPDRIMEYVRVVEVLTQVYPISTIAIHSPLVGKEDAWESLIEPPVRLRHLVHINLPNSEAAKTL